MGFNTLSAVLEKLIQRLCLNDFPCGYGSWRKTCDSPEGAEVEDKVEDTLLDLLSCPHSPWHKDESWSPQAPALRQLAVLTPERLHKRFIYRYFTTLRIVAKDVSVIDDGLLKFSKLEELVLSANTISEVASENLPSSLKILELRANRLSALNSLTSHPPPRLQYLGLGSNCLGSAENISHLTGTHWPELVCLDLSDGEFVDQKALLNPLSTLPCLRTLVLEGNPLTLAACYPALTVDRLHQLSCLDAVWISPTQRHSYRGLANKSDVISNQASATVSVGRMKGIPNPFINVDENAPEFPVVTYSYFITYEFLSHQTPSNLNLNDESARETEDGSNDADLQSNRNCEKETPKPDTRSSMVCAEEPCDGFSHESNHSTSKLPWSELMDFSDTQTWIVSDLGGLKRFFNQGLHLRIEEEKVLSWPAVPEEVLSDKSNTAGKDKKAGKGKETPVKPDKSKDKKKKCLSQLVQDAPIRTVLGSIHVPLQRLTKRGQKVDVLCELGALQRESEATPTSEKDLGKKSKEEKKKDGPKQKNTAASKGKGKDRKECETDVEPVTVEFSVELKKWQSASEAQ